MKSSLEGASRRIYESIASKFVQKKADFVAPFFYWLRIVHQVGEKLGSFIRKSFNSQHHNFGAKNLQEAGDRKSKYSI
jgi:hypothetical protein